MPAALSVVFSVPSKADVYQHCTSLFGLSESKLLTSFIAKNSKSTRRKSPSLSFLFPTFVCVCLPLFHLLLFLRVLPFFSPTLSLPLPLFHTGECCPQHCDGQQAEESSSETDKTIQTNLHTLSRLVYSYWYCMIVILYYCTAGHVVSSSICTYFVHEEIALDRIRL